MKLIGTAFDQNRLVSIEFIGALIDAGVRRSVVRQIISKYEFGALCSVVFEEVRKGTVNHKVGADILSLHRESRWPKLYLLIKDFICG